MPKDQRHKLSQKHQPSAKVASRIFAVPDAETEKVERDNTTSNVPANDLLRAIAAQPTNDAKFVAHVPTKKEKQQLKHERLLQRLAVGATPYSKSHNRRLKRKAKAGLSTDMCSIQKAITTIAEDILPFQGKPKSQNYLTSQPIKPAPGLIGESKGVTLTKQQRKRALELERLRQPAIIRNTEYQKNPFDAIRKHAENSLLSHGNSGKPA